MFHSLKSGSSKVLEALGEKVMTSTWFARPYSTPKSASQTAEEQLVELLTLKTPTKAETVEPKATAKNKKVAGKGVKEGKAKPFRSGSYATIMQQAKREPGYAVELT